MSPESRVGGADGLGGVFDDVEVEFLGEGHDLVHIGHLAVEVDGDDRLRRSRESGVGGSCLVSLEIADEP